ncbi:MAG: PDZ domain-containing protein [Candidatus Caenarcaniphilales bacterium]|nr:PDZ domain-containing protein [Candidatus Caenarcaniphilales bacterium]
MSESQFVQLINLFTAFTYSWTPALILLWFVIVRKPGSRILPGLCAFLLGAFAARFAGEINHLSGVYLDADSLPFFFSVGFTEEFIKCLASLAGLVIGLVILREPGKLIRTFQHNWIAQTLAGGLGFAAAENFVYGIDGQGGVARIVPLFAHIFFALYWGVGLYTASLEKDWGRRIFWMMVGFLEAVFFHGLYDCLVSDDVFPDQYRILIWLGTGAMILGTYLWHHSVLERLEEERPEEEHLLNDPIDHREDLTELKLPGIFSSLLLPGSGHLFYRKELLNGLTFLAMAILIPYLIVRFGVNMIVMNLDQNKLRDLISASKDPLQAFVSGIAGQLYSSFETYPELIKQALIQILFVYALAILSFVVVGIWSAWELSQYNADLDHKDRKRRYSAVIPISTLFISSILASFFLPVVDKMGKAKDGKGKEKPDAIIKEIPLGITMEVEQEKPEIEKPNISELPSNTSPNQLTIDKLSPEEQKLSDQLEQEERIRQRKGISNSKSDDPANLPEKLPEIGYIGVQLSEALVNDQLTPYIVLVYPNTSAARAGLQTGDFIIAVNGQSTVGLSAFAVSHLVRGPLGTSVELTVSRAGQGSFRVIAHRTGNIYEAKDKAPKPIEQ